MKEGVGTHLELGLEICETAAEDEDFVRLVFAGFLQVIARLGVDLIVHELKEELGYCWHRWMTGDTRGANRGERRAASRGERDGHWVNECYRRTRAAFGPLKQNKNHRPS